MSALTDILGELPLDDLASQLGASKTETKTAASQAITSLLGGMTHNAQSEPGERALGKALAKHATSKPVKVSEVDTEDGTKIVKHVLGTTPDQAAKAVSSKTGTDPNLIAQLLPILAPIVLAYLGNQATSKSTAGGGSLLSSLLGGVSGTSTNSSGGGLADLLSGVLGDVLGQKPAAKPAGKAQAQQDGGLLGQLLNSLF